jgi:hypothetical protein
MKLTTHFHLMPGIKISGAIPLLPLYAFMALTGKALPFYPNYQKITFRNKNYTQENYVMLG